MWYDPIHVARIEIMPEAIHGEIMTNPSLPHWDLSNVYPGLHSEPFKSDFQGLSQQIDAFEAFFASSLLPAKPDDDPARLSGLLSEAIDRLNALLRLSDTLKAYIDSFVSTDSYNAVARRILSQYEQVRVRQDKAWQGFERWVGALAEQLPAILAHGGSAKAHAFMVLETALLSQYLMSAKEEDLAAELSLSGASAWHKLQGTFTSQLTAEVELDGRHQTLPIQAVINLHAHPDPQVRERAYQAEMAVWEKAREPLAAALNGIKGSANTLNAHRGRKDALDNALDVARIDRETLEAMLAAMRASLPTFRRYFKAKARRLGETCLPWWDVFAPTGQTDRVYSYEEAKEFILGHFQRFSPLLAAFARRAFDHGWIDAEPRDGKRGGAFCMAIPGVEESRILCNFDGTLDQVTTIAHELGHGFHDECLFKASKTELQKITPMTLAETASIMCETIVADAALAQAASPQETLSILENQLIGDSQVIVDIYSRYLFESEVFERRKQAELSADELCEIMDRAQAVAYGDGLDPAHRHKYMWTWKPHYYMPQTPFYNFPYAFGLLFGTGLYAVYLQRGEAFIPEYINLLASTGDARPVDLAARFGMDLRRQAFWDESLAVIGRRIDRYINL